MTRVRGITACVVAAVSVLAAAGCAPEGAGHQRLLVRPVAGVRTAPVVPTPGASAPALPTPPVPAAVPVSRLHRLVAATKCLASAPLPAPTAHFTVDDPGVLVRDPHLGGGRLWFTAASPDTGVPAVRLDAVDTGTGVVTQGASEPHLQLFASTTKAGWGIELQERRVVQLDLTTGQVVRRWDAATLAGALGNRSQVSAPLSIAVADGVAYVLGWQQAGQDVVDSWLAAIDVATGGLRWTHDFHTGPGGWTWNAHASLTAVDGGAVVVFADGSLPGLRVWRLTTSGSLAAQRQVVLADVSGPPLVVAGSDGIYTIVWTPRAGDDNDDTWQLVRLDPTDLAPAAQVAVYGVFGIDYGPTGLWVQIAYACNDFVLARYDAHTLAASSAYRLPPYYDDYFDVSGDTVWILRQSADTDRAIDVASYDLSR